MASLLEIVVRPMLDLGFVGNGFIVGGCCTSYVKIRVWGLMASFL